MQVHEFVAAGDGDEVKAVLVEQLSTAGFTTDWRDDWTAVASRGSRTKNVLFGAFSPYSRIVLAIRLLDDAPDADADADADPDPDADADAGAGTFVEVAPDVDGAGTSGDVESAVRSAPAERHVLRMESRASGLLGGVMGVKRTRDGYAELRSALRAALDEAGRLVDERDPGPSTLA